MPTRRFPPPWSIEERNDACFVGKDSAGQKLAYVYFEDDPPFDHGGVVAVIYHHQRQGL